MAALATVRSVLTFVPYGTGHFLMGRTPLVGRRGARAPPASWRQQPAQGGRGRHGIAAGKLDEAAPVPSAADRVGHCGGGDGGDHTIDEFLEKLGNGFFEKSGLVAEDDLSEGSLTVSFNSGEAGGFRTASWFDLTLNDVESRIVDEEDFERDFFPDLAVCAARASGCAARPARTRPPRGFYLGYLADPIDFDSLCLSGVERPTEELEDDFGVSSGLYRLLDDVMLSFPSFWAASRIFTKSDEEYFAVCCFQTFSDLLNGVGHRGGRCWAMYSHIFSYLERACRDPLRNVCCSALYYDRIVYLAMHFGVLSDCSDSESGSFDE